jgi:plasmid stabilization system protein ParE
MNIRYSPRATKDLQSILEYLTERSPRGAVNVLTAIYAAIEFIRRYPDAAQPTRIEGIRAKASSGIASKFSTAWFKAMTLSRSFMCAIRRAAPGLTMEIDAAFGGRLSIAAGLPSRHNA